MPIKQIVMKFNEVEQKELERLEDLLGLSRTYGADPKAVKFAVRLALSYASSLEQKVLPALSDADLEMLLCSIKKLRFASQRA